MKKKKIHHIGKVVQSIDDELLLLGSLGFKVDKEIYIDKEQKVKVGLAYSDNDIIMELLEPLDESSPIWNFHKNGGGLHHYCIEVENIDKYNEYIKKNKLGYILTKKTTSIFDKRKVSFFMTRTKNIIELIEPK